MTWHSSVAMPQESNRVTRSGRIIRAPDRSIYAPAVELQYLGEMVELDHEELVGLYISLRQMELALIGAGTGGGINHTSELKVLNYKKAINKYNVLMPIQ